MLLALTALLLLPGLLVVRSPWWAVPFLSLSFWWASWAWLPPGGPGRLAFLQTSLLLFGLLLLFRLLRLEGASRPQAPTLVAVLAALAAAAAGAREALPFDTDLSFHAVVAQVLTWRDGIPEGFAPLLGPLSFQTHAPGLPFLAADTGLLSGGGAFRSTLAGAAIGPPLLTLGVFAAARRWTRPRLAAVLTVAAALAILLWARVGVSWPLALAFLLAALALMSWPVSNARAVSIGALLGAALVADLRVLLPILGLLALGSVRLAGLLAGREPQTRHALGLVLLACLLAAGPVCWRLAPPPWVGRTFPTSEASATPPDLAVMSWLADGTPPLAVVCIEPGGPGIWIPAMAGRAVSVPHLPIYLQSGGGREDQAHCTVRFGHGPPDCPRPLYVQAPAYLCAS